MIRKSLKFGLRQSRKGAVIVASCLVFAGFAQAQDADIVGSLSEAETQKVGAFARGVGQTYVCAPEGDQADMREDIRLVFNFVAQDMGTDAAFLFAVGVGYGSRHDSASLDCDKLMKDWSDTRDKFGLTEEGQ